MHSKLFYFACLSLLLIACNPTRKANNGVLKEKSSSFLLKRMDKQAFSADWISAKSKINIQYQGQSVSASMNLRMQKDKVIWAQVKKFNFEVGRLKVTPDSMFLLDRFNRQYVAAPITELTRFTSAPIDFPLLQDLIFGRAFFWSRDDLKASVKQSDYRLDQDWQRTQSQYLIDGFSFLLKNQSHQLDEYGANIIADQGQYPKGELSNFAYFRSYQIEGPAAINLEIDFSKVEINEAQEFPFSIPDQYTPLRLE